MAMLLALWRSRWDAAMLLLYAGLVAGIALAYVGAERTILSGAAAGQHDAALFLAVQLGHGEFALAWADLWSRAGSDVSAWFALPLVPALLLFGDGRATFATASALLQVLPFALLVGTWAARLVPEARRFAFWSTAFVALATPAVWVPALQGFPHLAATALVLGALLILESEPDWGGAAAAGALLGWAVLLHASFLPFALLALGCLLATRHDPRMVAVSAAAMLAVVAALGLPLLGRLASGEVGLGLAGGHAAANLPGYLDVYGWLPLSAAAVGLAWGAARLATLFGAGAALLLAFGTGPAAAHTAAPLSAVLVLGLMLLPWRAWVRFPGRVRLAASAGLAAMLGVNAAIAMMPDAGPGGAFAQASGPQQRADHAELLRLVGYLRQVAGPDEPIHVVAASPVLSADLLWHADRAVQRGLLLRLPKSFWNGAGLAIPNWAPPEDGREPYPLDRLLRARVVVVATPLQRLPAGGQSALAAAHAVFAERWDLARDFEALPERFALAGGVEAAVYRRTRPTSIETAVAALDRMRQHYGRPGGQGEWLNLGRDTAWFNGGGGRKGLVAWSGAPVALARVEPLDKPLTVAGDIDACVAGLSVEAAVHDGDGRRRAAAKSARLSSQTGHFELPVDEAGGGYLVVTLAPEQKTALGRPCWLTLR